MFAPSSLLEMDDPWVKKKELVLEGLNDGPSSSSTSNANGSDDESEKDPILDDFAALWTAKTQAKLAFACKRTFERWDMDRNGFLEPDEFMACMRELCTALGMAQPSAAECLAMFTMLDLDKSGTVSFEEFHQWWTNMYVANRWDDASVKDASGVKGKSGSEQLFDVY